MTARHLNRQRGRGIVMVRSCLADVPGGDPRPHECSRAIAQFVTAKKLPEN